MNIMNPSHATNGDPKVAFRSPRRNRPNLICESLEHRQLLSVDAAVTSATQVTAQPDLNVIPLVSTGPTGYSPQQIRAAYGVNAIKFSGGTVTGNGAGETIAIVDAYNDPNIASDLAKFDSEYGLSAPPSFTVENLGGTTTNAGWAWKNRLTWSGLTLSHPRPISCWSRPPPRTLIACSAPSVTPASFRASVSSR